MMSIRIFSKDQQVSGGFDEGKLVEQKPIGFPGEGSAVERVGTLFYWPGLRQKKMPIFHHILTEDLKLFLIF